MAQTETSPVSVLLYPGAGTRRDHPTLVAVQEALGRRRVHREEFVYQTTSGRRPPPKAPVLIDEIVSRAKRVRGPIVLGGRSMGGRMCSMAVAAGRVRRARGLVLVAYPLHPPGRPERLRTEHFGDIEVPCLFVSGTRDSFGSQSELEAATEAIPGDVEHVWIHNGTHDLRGADSQIAEAVAEWITRLEC